jgi:hypothetical protein
MRFGAIAAPPRPTFNIAVADGRHGRARTGPRPLPRGVGAPVRPKIGVTLKAVAAPGANPGKHAHRLTAETQPVRQPMLLAGKLYELHAADRFGGKGHAVPRDRFPRVDHEYRTR